MRIKQQKEFVSWVYPWDLRSLRNRSLQRCCFFLSDLQGIWMSGRVCGCFTEFEMLPDCALLLFHLVCWCLYEPGQKASNPPLFLNFTEPSSLPQSLHWGLSGRADALVLLLSMCFKLGLQELLKLALSYIKVKFLIEVVKTHSRQNKRSFGWKSFFNPEVPLRENEILAEGWVQAVLKEM